MMKKHLFSALLLTLFVGHASATTVVRMDFDRQAVTADTIVVGIAVSERETIWRGHPFTRVLIEVSEVVAGKDVGGVIEIMQPGTKKVKVMGVKKLPLGAPYLLLLEELPDGYYRLVGFNQGAHRIVREKGSDRRFVVFERRSKNEAPGMTLDAARKRIRVMREKYAGKAGK